jgi:hypothetical protein
LITFFVRRIPGDPFGELAAAQTASDASVHVFEFSISDRGVVGARHVIVAPRDVALDPHGNVVDDGEPDVV